jgi:hypothetical protein
VSRPSSRFSFCSLLCRVGWLIIDELHPHVISSHPGRVLQFSNERRVCVKHASSLYRRHRHHYPLYRLAVSTVHFDVAILCRGPLRYAASIVVQSETWARIPLVGQPSIVYNPVMIYATAHWLFWGPVGELCCLAQHPSTALRRPAPLFAV